MPDQYVILIDRIEERLATLGLTDRKASLRAIGKPDLIRDIRRGKRPLWARVIALAEALETTTEYLQGATDDPKGVAPPEGELRKVVPHPQEMPQDIPVYGTAHGADEEYASAFDGRVIIEQTDLNTGEVVDRFRRPPNLVNRRDVYGLFVAGDSMEPAYESGRGILVDPKRPPSSRDYVVVYLRGNGNDSTVGVLIKRLVRRSSSFIELQQYNPPATFRLDAKQVREIHRVMPWDEAFGI